MQGTDHPKTNGGRLLKRGDPFDIEDQLTTHRLRAGHAILRSLGLEPEWTHSDSTHVEWGRVKHVCDYRCKATWPEHVTGKTFDLAYTLADEHQTARGKYHQAQINRNRAARHAT